MPKFFESIGNFFTGTPSKINQISNLRPDQEDLSNQLVNAGKGPGAGGTFGTAADYYRNLLSDNSADYQAFANPALRQYYQDIVPNISEQFAGMGAGGLSSSGFRNAQNQGAVDLSERLGQIRANLRHAGASGLSNIGQLGLQNFQQTYEQPGTPGFFDTVSSGIGNLISQSAPSGIGSMGTWFGGRGNKVAANTSPYSSNSMQSSPNIGSQMPNFLQRP